MSESLFSDAWYRVSTLKPRLRSHAAIHRHHYRGTLWYVLQDHLSGRFHRFAPSAHFVIGRLDGKATLQEIWEEALAALGDDAPTQDQMIQLMAQLHAGDLLLCEVPPDSLELFRRYRRQERMKWLQRFANPLSLKIPLIDPEAFLERWKDWVCPAFSVAGTLVWLLVVGLGVVLAAGHWDELTRDVSDQVLAPGNLVTLLLVYPFIKLLHELGHAFAVKAWGGEVHELGIMLIVLMPVPYVDATAASAFRSKWRRMVVGAAGILVELFVAAIALMVWLNLQPGPARSVCYNLMLIGGVSTLFFNGNPLLRFDGYYIFADWVEIPNLANRCNRYLLELLQRVVLGLKEVRRSTTAPGERRWLLSYGLSSLIYRLMVIVGISLFVAEKFFFIGVVIAVWGFATSLLLPIGKGVKFLLTNPRVARRKSRALGAAAAVAVLLVAIIGLIPLPLYTITEGVIWPPEQTKVRTATDGFVKRLLAEPESHVHAGDPLIEIEDPLLSKRLAVAEARHAELEARYHALWPGEDDFKKAQMVKDELVAAQVERDQLREKVREMILRARTDGRLIVPHAVDLPGKWLKQGETAAYVVQYPLTTVRAVVTQERSGLLTRPLRRVDVRLSEQTGKVYEARLVRFTPAATDQLPSVALGESGGGAIAVSPDDRKGETAFEPVFQVDLDIPAETPWRNLGTRVHVRFDHGTETFAEQVYRRLRQLFLKRFQV